MGEASAQEACTVETEEDRLSPETEVTQAGTVRGLVSRRRGGHICPLHSVVEAPRYMWL